MAVAPARVKPHGPSALDWGNPITKGLVFYCIYNTPVPVDLVTGTPGVRVNGPTQRATIDGPAANLTAAATSYFSFASKPQWNTNGEKTLLWRGSLASGGTYRHLFGKSDGAGDATATPYGFWTAENSGQVPFFISANSDYVYWQGPSLSLNTMHTLAVVTKNVHDTPVWFLNGAVSNGFGNAGAGNGASTGASADLLVGRRADGAVQMDGVHSITALWNRKLTIRELRELNDAPFSLLLAPRRRSVKGATNNTYNESVSDSLTLTDSASAAAIFPNSASDSITLSDAASAAAVFAGSVADSLSLSDSVASTADYGVSVDDTLAFTDAATNDGATAPTGGGGPVRKRRTASDEPLGNRPRRNSRQGVAEEEMAETLAALRPGAQIRIMPGDDENDDEEAILWLIH